VSGKRKRIRRLKEKNGKEAATFLGRSAGGCGVCTWTAYAEKCSRAAHESSITAPPAGSLSISSNGDEWTSGCVSSAKSSFLIGFVYQLAVIVYQPGIVLIWSLLHKAINLPAISSTSWSLVRILVFHPKRTWVVTSVLTIPKVFSVHRVVSLKF
jgi:hypothetical protein